jgi:membrane protein implicated in regulation of membrane protease activity
MLRIGLLILGLALTVAGLVMLFRDNCTYQPFLIWGIVLVIAVLCERWRYQRNEHKNSSRWQQTGERFEDPETGKTVEVHYDPTSGERRYVKK